MNYFSVLLLVIGLAGVNSAASKCTNGNIVNRGSKPYYFPSTWNENQTAPSLGADQSCSWTVTIPSGYYAKLIINGKTGDNVSQFQILDSNGNLYDTQHEKMEPWYFPYPKFTLIVSNVAVSTFAFKITWAPFPTTINYNAGIGMNPHVVNITQSVFAAEFSAVAGISLLSFPANLKNTVTLRSAMVFQGKDFNGQYVNSLYELYKTHNQWISTNGVVYIVNVEARNVLDKVLIQESGYTKDIHPYHELVCSASSTCSKNINGGKGKSGLVFLGAQNQTIVDITMDQKATLSVYYGSPTPFGLFQTYNGSSIHSQLPLTFEGGSGPVQYVISTGKSSITFRMSA